MIVVADPCYKREIYPDHEKRRATTPATVA
jgi:hypothetical protein